MPIPTLKSLTSSLDTFVNSSSSFQIIHTSPASLAPTPIRTLYILDSSFNPPTLAHQGLALSPIHRHQSLRQKWKTDHLRRGRGSSEGQKDSPSATLEDGGEDPGPARLLLLLATKNADKAPTPAAFPQRLAMMCLLAEDIGSFLSNDNGPNTSISATSAAATSKPTQDDTKAEKEEGEGEREGEEGEEVVVDVAVTKSPLFTDKLHLISTSPFYTFSASSSTSTSTSTSSPSPSPSPSSTHSSSPSQIQQIHLLGHDTLIRLFDPKYYPSSPTPLSPLSSLLGNQHRIRVARRPADRKDDNEEEDEEGDEQAALLSALSRGELEHLGAQRHWAERIELVDIPGAAGVSSTAVRKMREEEDQGRKEGQWKKLMGQNVAEWVEREGLYVSL